MSKLKVLFMVLSLVGISGLSAVGATGAEVGSLVPIGIGLGSAVAAVIAVVKKR